MTNQTPIFTALKKYANKDISSFHTPGHKNNADFFKKINLMEKLDYTEINGLDFLYNPSGIIKKAQENAAKLYNSKKSLFCTGGCTQTVKAMLMLAMPKGGKLLTGRIIHSSAVDAMAVLDIDPVFIKNSYKAGFFAGIKAEEVKNELERHKDIKAVYITSPDYFGVLSEIKEISKLTKQYNIPLMVDNAHGSHLKFLYEDIDPITLGADLSANSLHKTLPVLTGGAMLNINNDKFINAEEAIRFFGSTSPSYPVMASIDLAINWLKNNGKKEYEKLLQKTNEINKLIVELKLNIPKSKTDLTRISINAEKFNLTEQEILKIFHDNFIEPECIDDKNIILIPTPFNKDKDFERLKKALKQLASAKSFLKPEEKIFISGERIMSIRNAIMSENEITETKKSLGKIAASAVYKCPPGIPIVIPGEIITKNIIDNILNAGIMRIKVIK